MKWALIVVALLELAFILISLAIFYDASSRRSFGNIESVLFIAGVMAIVNGLVPILRSKNLDTTDKRKLSLLILLGFGLQLVGWLLADEDFDEFFKDVFYDGISEYKLFWLGTLIALTGIFTSYWHHRFVAPVKKWVSTEPN
jgi:hypothetical protein